MAFFLNRDGRISEVFWRASGACYALRNLITGASGFIGQHLTNLLRQKGEEVYGFFYSPDKAWLPFCLKPSKLLQCDIRDFKRVSSLIEEVEPDRIYHLAAQSRPTESWKNPWLAMEVNVLGTVNLLEAVMRSRIRCRILVACSSAEYGNVSEAETPITESCPLRPLSQYAVSKAAQDLLAYQYARNYGLETVRVRIFGTTGPGKSGDVCSDFAGRIVAIERGLMDQPMRVGNLEPIRDLTDVRDMVRALWLAVEKGVAGEVYNACSGRGLKVSEILEAILGYCRIDIIVKIDEALLRPSDEPIILGDCSKLKALTGWGPSIPIEKTLKDTVEYWRSQVLI